MNYDDMHSLAALLDKNRAFSRPDNQMTGYSLQEHTSKPSRLEHAAADVAVDMHGAQIQPVLGPASIALPPAVVDAQLGLPKPSHSKDRRKAAAGGQCGAGGVARTRPSLLPCFANDDDLWTQEEMCACARHAPCAVRRAAHGRDGLLQKEAASCCVGDNNTDADAIEVLEKPEHTILFQQKVTAEDVYLGVDFTHDSSSASSDGIVVRVTMPRVTSMADIALQVAPYELSVRTTNYCLVAPLMRRVVEGKAEAKWDNGHKTLTVVLTIDENDRPVKVLA